MRKMDRRAAYERADGLQGRLSGKVFRDKVEPNWIEGGPFFWYRVAVGPDRHRFIFVDPDHAERREAFDHARLAEQLSEALGREVEPERLPFRALEYSERMTAAEFQVGGQRFRYDLDAEALEALAPPSAEEGSSGVNVLPRPRTARRNGPETEIAFVNRTRGKIQIFWVNDVENPRFYAEAEPGGEHRQHTYAGHVWLVQDSEGKTVGIYEATEKAGVAVVDGSWKLGEEERPKEESKDKEPPSFASPDGTWRAELRRHNVTLIRTENDEQTALTTAGNDKDPFQAPVLWSPDSRYLLAVQEKKAEVRQVHFVESSPKDQLQPALHSFNYVKPGDPIHHPRPRLFDAEAGREIPISDVLFPNPYQRIYDFEWSRDSSRFTFIYNERGHRIFRLVAVDAATGAARTLIEEAPETFVCYSSKTFWRRLYETDEVVWMSERDGWNHLYLFRLSDGSLIRQLTQGEWVVRRVDRVDAEKRAVWFQAGGLNPDDDPYHVHFCRVDLDTGEITRLTEGDGTHDIHYSPDGEYLIDAYSRVDMAPVTELRRASDGGMVVELERADASALEEAGWQRPERIAAKGRDGETDIWGVLYKPTDFDPSKSYPVIEAIYAGPHSAHVPKRFSHHHGPQTMAEIGFIVVQIDGMGTSHRSKAFHDVCWQNLGDAGFPDRIAWMWAAAETRPWMDLSRVGIYGGSAGGQNAMRALIAHHDFYKAASADCGCHDNRMDKIWWNEQWMGYPIGDHYAASSNVDQAHRLEGALLLIVGELDRNVDPASTMQVVDALIKADKDFEFLAIPGAGHGAAGSPYGRRRQRDFFVRHLLEGG